MKKIHATLPVSYLMNYSLYPVMHTSLYGFHYLYNMVRAE